jgi:hypothetical protein
MSLIQPSSVLSPVVTLFDTADGDEIINQYYRDAILRILSKILPSDFFMAEGTNEATQAKRKSIFRELLPLIALSNVDSFPGNISFFALSKYRSNSFKFFFEMISRWLVPGQRLNVVLVFASDFRLCELSDEVYTICEVMIRVENAAALEDIRRYFPIIQAEIALGIDSAFYAQRILDVKGLSADEKTASIQDFIAFLVKRFPNAYDLDVFTEMQHFLVTCRDDFKAARRSRHLSRIISIHYLFRKSIRDSIKKKPQQRFLSFKIFRARIYTPTGSKRILALLIGINFLRDQETFDAKHIIKGVQHYIRSAQLVENSFFVNKTGTDNISTLYLELEKKDGTDFSPAEIRKLRKELPSDLKNRIEYKLHPIFMPRNEEEIMRNILILTEQIRYLRDIPQVFITFDEQAHSHLFFTVILARVLKTDSLSIQDLFAQTETFLEYVHDRVKITGYIRKKYAKQATVFRVKLPKDIFLRADHSIDLYKARQTVVAELSRIVGEIRDYNGGMISKQHELLTRIRDLLVDQGNYDELLLENFFYSLAPVVIRAVLDPRAFKTLFVMLVEGLREYKQEGYYVKFYAEPFNIFALIICEDTKIKNALNKAIQELHIPSMELASAYAKANGHACMGYICCPKNEHMKGHFFQVIQETLQDWEAKRMLL